uniref:J domain-containing protein n=1 Tax=Odontella aurita TaxID=265563 RepID=A0A7S4JEH1_9STRA|mmetsp:Transcript_44886/g.137084  ORF Transcript_44886/g.137084 Transcript_44886/m.137084 type:complete len:531 (+) Transcript_44886:113-1705(+)
MLATLSNSSRRLSPICSKRCSLPQNTRRLLPFRYPCSVSVRFISSYGGRSNKDSRHRYQHGFFLDALPFSVSPEEALDEFKGWAIDEQGLRYLIDWNAVKIGAAYVPVWSFDVNVRFATSTASGQVRYDAKPEPFTVFQNDTVHLPGLSSYAGYTFRRTLINPVHNTTLAFIGKNTVPFGSWMLRDMRLSNGQLINVFPDPWNTTKGRAFALVAEELKNLANEDEERIGRCEVQTEILTARRVFMPTFIVDYSVLGAEYCAFISGCDTASGVSGVDHRAFSFSNNVVEQASDSFLSQVQNVTRWGRSMGAGPMIALFNILMNAATRVLARFHVIGAIGAGFVAFRKIVKPWIDNRTASAEWERQREHEAYMQDHWNHKNDFVDSGYAKKYFQQNRTRILRYLSREQVHDSGTFDWYKQWEEWARKQWEQQQNMNEQQTGQEQRQKRAQRHGRKGATREFVWDFDPKDPYSVLGIRQGATKQQVSQAFRREMLKYHPDTQGTEATQAERERALERSKLITEAYRKIKTNVK